MDRIVSAGEANNFNGEKEGDYIIDSLDKSGNITYYFAKDQLVSKGLKDGATIWFDQKAFTNKPIIKFCHTSNPMEPWLDNLSFGVLGDGAFECSDFSIGGLKNVNILPGFKVDGGDSGHCISIDVRDGGSIKMRGFETRGGSTGVRIGSSLAPIRIENIDMADFKISDTFWEGMYLGSTKATFAKIANLKVKNGKIIRPGAEWGQFQHVYGGLVEDITIIDSANNYLGNPTLGSLPQNYQDSGLQLVLDGGYILFKNILTQGWANNGITIDSSAEYSGQLVEFKNCLLTEGKGIPCYIHNDYNGKVKFSDTYCTKQNFEYFKRKQETLNLKTIDGKVSAVIGEIVKLGSEKELRYIDGYKNVTRWAPVYPKWFFNVAGQPVLFTSEEKVIYGRTFYKALVPTTAQPGLSPDWEVLPTLSDDYNLHQFLNLI